MPLSCIYDYVNTEGPDVKGASSGLVEETRLDGNLAQPDLEAAQVGLHDGQQIGQGARAVWAGLARRDDLVLLDAGAQRIRVPSCAATAKADSHRDGGSEAMLARVAAAVLVLATCGLAHPALALQCDKATQRPDKLICADPALRSADAAMSAAYASLRASLPKAEQPGLLADQRRWLSVRAACIADDDGKDVADAVAIACMRTDTASRQAFLDGRLPGATANTPRITPRFLYRAGGHDLYAVAIAYPEIAGTDTAAERAANALLRRTAIGDWTGPRHDEGDHLLHQVRYRMTLATPLFASIDFSTYDDENAAYPTTGGMAVNIDLATGKAVPLADLLRPGAIDAAIKLCTAQLTDYYSKAIGQPWQPSADGVRDVANNVANWEFYPDQAILAFRENSLGPHAMGAYDCTIDAKALATMVKPRSPVGGR